MLVLGRKEGEEIFIRVHRPCLVRVRLVQDGKNRTRIGIEAPRDAASISRPENDHQLTNDLPPV